MMREAGGWEELEDDEGGRGERKRRGRGEEEERGRGEEWEVKGEKRSEATIAISNGRKR